MKNLNVLFRMTLVGFAMLVSAGNAGAQVANCSGVLFGEQAVIQGVRQSGPYGSTYYAGFQGRAMTQSAVFEMVYEGIATGTSFPGQLRSNAGVIRIGVLDKTDGGNRMYIYGGRETLGPPEKYGAFNCRWTAR